jgi:hypothetical protein
MKDEKGHGSDPKGAHSEGVQQVGKQVREPALNYPGSRAPYGVHANHDKQEYYVYHIPTGMVVTTFPYKTESQRALAAGRASIGRETLNRQVRP